MRVEPILLFDIDDTILDFKRCESTALTYALNALGVNPAPETLRRYSAINARQWERLERGEITRAYLLVHRFELLFEELGVDVSGAEAQHIYEQSLKMQHFEVPGAIAMLSRLSERYDTYAVSNGNIVTQDSRIALSGIDKYFKDIFISEAVGYDKPSKEYFDYCFAHIPGFERERAIIIGDSLTSDMLGGKNAGIKTCWFNPGRKEPKDVYPDYTVYSIDEIEPLIDSIFG